MNMKFIQIFLLVLIVIGIILLLSQTMWVPRLVDMIVAHDVLPPTPQATTKTQEKKIILGTSATVTKTEKNSWKTFVKPSDAELQKMLTPLQYQVTQHEGTETPFRNEYTDNHADGIYVDIVSGEPLFSSKDKYDSGTGWPSFVKPLAPENIVTKTDSILGYTRVEVRSKHADSHLGHVFTDGPRDRGGLRYCMNSAAMRFISKENLHEMGYGEYLEIFK